MAINAYSATVGSLIFIAVWLAILKTKWASFPLGRSLATVTGACLMVAFNILPPNEAFKAINLPTIILLTGTMLISAHIEKQGYYVLFSDFLVKSTSNSNIVFLWKTIIVSAISSAFLTNDTICVILPQIVLRACAKRKLNPEPFLLAVATSANVGSSCSPIGNPQNMIIASLSGLTFLQFLLYITLPSVLSTLITGLFIQISYRNHFVYDWTSEKLQLLGVETPVDGSSASISVTSGSLTDDSSKVVSAPETAQDDSVTIVSSSFHSSSSSLQSRLIVLVLLATPLLLIFADQWIGLSWMSISIGCLLCVIDINVNSDKILERVDGSLLFFFSGLFVVVAGLTETMIPDALWNSISSVVSMSSFSGLLIYSLIILIGSNTVSNVPLTLLLAPKLSEYAYPSSLVAWVLLAFVSTVAGNFTLVGSVANLIVAEKSKHIHELSFIAYAKIGTPTTLLSLLVGVPIIAGLVSAFPT
jgi:Na+/H+ antiporter NhaD/arsenite permease-like protein